MQTKFHMKSMTARLIISCYLYKYTAVNKFPCPLNDILFNTTQVKSSLETFLHLNGSEKAIIYSFGKGWKPSPMNFTCMRPDIS